MIDPAHTSVRVPAECSQNEFNAFEVLVKLSGEVNPNGLRNRIENAYLLAWVVDSDGEMAGVAGLKNPEEAHRTSVFRESQTDEDPKMYDVELGWIFVRSEYRDKGLASKLVKELLAKETSNRMYATVRANNKEVPFLMKKFGFVQSGAQYPSTEGDYDLVLYIKPE